MTTEEMGKRFLEAMVRLQVREMVLAEKQNGETNISGQAGGYVDVAGGNVQNQPVPIAQPQQGS